MQRLVLHLKSGFASEALGPKFNHLNKHLNDHPFYSSFDKKLREASMHNLHENGPFGHTLHVHINSSGGRR